MPFLILALLPLVILLLVLLSPVILVQRYRVGTARRQARGWVAALNAWGFALSAVLIIASAALTSLWVPGALRSALIGLAGGGLLGLVGYRLTRWDVAGGQLHYTPNRWLVVLVLGVVAARLLYGFWRTATLWGAGEEGAVWWAASGVAASLAAGAVVIGYSGTYAAAVRRRIRRAA